MSTANRLAGIALVFMLTCIGWVVLGNVTSSRTGAQREALTGAAADLWGSAQHQKAPALVFVWTTEEIVERTETVAGTQRVVRETVRREHSEPRQPASTDINVSVDSDPRRKGLIWYAFYDLGFDGRWSYKHDREVPGQLRLTFAFPDPGGLYDGFRFEVNGQDLARRLRPENGVVAALVPVEPGQKIELAVSYRTRGSDEWRYVPADGVVTLRAGRHRLALVSAGVDPDTRDVVVTAGVRTDVVMGRPPTPTRPSTR